MKQSLQQKLFVYLYPYFEITSRHSNAANTFISRNKKKDRPTVVPESNNFTFFYGLERQ